MLLSKFFRANFAQNGLTQTEKNLNSFASLQTLIISSSVASGFKSVCSIYLATSSKSNLSQLLLTNSLFF